jgi:hypothetical protein
MAPRASSMCDSFMTRPMTFETDTFTWLTWRTVSRFSPSEDLFFGAEPVSGVWMICNRLDISRYSGRKWVSQISSESGLHRDNLNKLLAEAFMEDIICKYGFAFCNSLRYFCLIRQIIFWKYTFPIPSILKRPSPSNSLSHGNTIVFISCECCVLSARISS